MITGEQVKEAVLASGITYIHHHDCNVCKYWIAYVIINNNLYFSPSCSCSWSPSRLASWDEAANWINMQTNEKAKIEIMKKFGITP